MARNNDPEAKVREIRRKTRRRFSAEEKIRIVLEGLRGEDSIAELCRREGIAPNLYYNWSKEFLEAGKKRLQGDTKRQATSSEVTDLRKENQHLKELVADLSLKYDVLKKSPTGWDNGSGR
jgi:transposase